ncbi:MAG: hypothetical protein IKB75_02820 [Clostridia bacterium]|nr:hypothetical protein [Clostridia bacterium]
MSKKALAILKIILCCTVAVLGIVAMIFSILPTSGDLIVREVISVSSAPLDNTRTSFSSYMVGELFNPSDKEIVIDSLIVEIGNGQRPLQKEARNLGEIRIPARCKHPLYLTWEGTQEFDRVASVKAVVGGQEITLDNPAKGLQMSEFTLLYLAFTVFAVMLSVRSIKGLYYLTQEEHAIANASAEKPEGEQGNDGASD